MSTAAALQTTLIAAFLVVLLLASLSQCALALGAGESTVIRTEGFVEGPRIASDGAGSAWLVWLSRLPGDRERICLSEYHGEWSPGLPIAGAEGRLESPAIACAAGGKPMAVWVRIDKDKWTLAGSAYSGGGFGAIVDVPSGSGKAAGPALAAGSDSDYWLVWESYRRGGFRVLLSHCAKGKWGRPIAVTDGKSNAYSPALAVDGNAGKVWIAYTGVDPNKQYSIYFKSLDTKSGKLSGPVAVASGGCLVHEPGLNKYPTVACDRQGRVWVAYERDSLGDRSVGGRDAKRIRGNHMGVRDCSVVCYESGKLYQVAAAQGASGRDVLTGANDHYPTLTLDPSGRVWLFSRDSVKKPQPPWNIRASCLDGGKGWSSPSSLLGDLPLGRLSSPAVAFTDAKTMWVAWQSDNLPLWPTTNEQTNIRVGRVDLPPVGTQLGAPVLEATVANAGDKSAAGLYVRPWIKRRQITEGGSRYTLLYGNLHEHTLISRCWVDGSDATPDDDYRYGRDIEGYDFVGLTDHGFDMSEYEWRGIIRAAEFYDDPPFYIGIPGYEWTRLFSAGPVGWGHRNIFFASPDDAARFVSSVGQVYEFNLPESETMDKVWKILRDKGIKEAVTIPHHPADKVHPVDWNFHDPYYQSVVEVFQTRQSAEYAGCPRQTGNATDIPGCWVQDALARGLKMGFVASGDHNSMGAGVAAVWVKDISRRGIIEALLARRCYATTGDKIFMDFRVDGHLMGEEYETAKPPRLTARIECVRPISEIVVFKNNQVLVKIPGDALGSATSYNLDYVDKDFAAASYYYLRVIQGNNEIGWASPVWVARG